MSEDNAVVWIHDTHNDAETSLRALQRSGFARNRLSIAVRDHQVEARVVGFYNTGDRMKAWGRLGAFWGGLWGMLFGAGRFVIPSIGPLVAFGPVVGWLVGALESAVVVGGLCAIGAALYGLGLPRDSVLRQETSLRASRFLVMARGTAADIDHAKAVLASSQPLGAAAPAGQRPKPALRLLTAPV